ncbi:hypothetical protein M3Y95_01103900 [Aphelenchoides besseyi]|nr:hypothetical protein M3Y95_01103900 [Aphelenchoides besseyi]
MSIDPQTPLAKPDVEHSPTGVEHSPTAVDSNGLPHVEFERLRLSTLEMCCICFWVPPLAIYIKEKQVNKMVAVCFLLWLCFGVPGFFFSLWFVFCRSEDEQARPPDIPLPRSVRLLRWAYRHRNDGRREDPQNPSTVQSQTNVEPLAKH